MSILDNLDKDNIEYTIRDNKVVIELGGLLYEFPINEFELKKHEKR